MVDIFCPWFSKKYLLAASGFAVSVCRGGEDKFVNCPRNISLDNEETRDSGESRAIKGSLGAKRQSKNHYRTAAL